MAGGGSYAGDSDALYIREDAFVNDIMDMAALDNQYWARHEVVGAIERGRERGVFDDREMFWDWIQQFKYWPGWKEQGRYIPVDRRRHVMERDGNMCQACGATDDLQIDHRKPVSRGGSHRTGNLQVPQSTWNQKKKDKTMTEWGGP